MLSASRSAASRRLSGVARQAVAGIRAHSAGDPTFSGTVYKESERARENQFFSKEDEKTLRKLLTKVKGQAEAAGSHHREAELHALQPIISKYKITTPDVEALLNWRHSHDY